ncbi:MAG: glycosyltransferase family 4 protein [Thermodesulfobacteriota bacterium]
MDVKNNNKIRMGLIQNTIAPYRIPLFESIAKHPQIDFTLYLMAEERPSYPQWNKLINELTFRTILVPGLRIRFRSLDQICINPKLVPVLLRDRPEVLILSGFSFSNIWGFLYKLLTGRPLIIWSEGTALTETYRSSIWLRNSIRRIMARFADGFVDAGLLSRQYLEGLLPTNQSKPFHRAYNAIDSVKFKQNCLGFKQSGVAYSEFRKRYPEVNILFSGRLVEIKGIRRMISVYEKILERSKKPIGLIVLGQGELKDYLERTKKEKELNYLFLEGFITAENYYKYFTVADLFLLLSEYDCNPLVIFEALTCGLPIVISDRAGNAQDFIIDGKNGYIVDPYDLEDVVAKVINVLENKEKDSIRQTSQEIVRKANYDDSAAAFIELSRKLVSNT